MTAPEPSTYEQLYAATPDVLGGEYQDYLAVFSPESAEQPAALRDSVFAADNTIPKVFVYLVNNPTPEV